MKHKEFREEVKKMLALQSQYFRSQPDMKDILLPQCKEQEEVVAAEVKRVELIRKVRGSSGTQSKEEGFFLKVAELIRLQQDYFKKKWSADLNAVRLAERKVREMIREFEKREKEAAKQIEESKQTCLFT